MSNVDLQGIIRVRWLGIGRKKTDIKGTLISVCIWARISLISNNRLYHWVTALHVFELLRSESPDGGMYCICVGILVYSYSYKVRVYIICGTQRWYAMQYRILFTCTTCFSTRGRPQSNITKYLYKTHQQRLHNCRFVLSLNLVTMK